MTICDCEPWPGAARAQGAPVAVDPSVIAPPRRIPGTKRVYLSPYRYFTLTRVTRTDVDCSDIDLFLTEQPIEAISKDGFSLGDDLYSSDELLEHTFRANGPQHQEYFARYDRSRLARGVLDEVKLFIRTPHGDRLIATCTRRGGKHGGWDPGTFAMHREDYYRGLVDRVAGLQAEHLALARGIAAQDELLRGIEARRKRAAGKRDRPDRVAKPIEPPAPPRSAIGSALSAATAAAEPFEAPVKASLALLVKERGEAGRRGITGPEGEVPGEPPRRSSIGSALANRRGTDHLNDLG